METTNNDNSFENYFFGLVLKKEIIKHQLKEICEVLTKEKDGYEDQGEKDVFTFENLLKAYLFGFKPLNGLSIEDSDNIAKLFFGNEFPGIEMFDTYIEFVVSKNIEEYREMSLEKKGVVFHIIFSIIEDIIDIDNEDVVNFIMSEAKENIETELLYLIENVLKTFEHNTREILLKFKSISENILSKDDFLSEEELKKFKNNTLMLTNKLISDLKENDLINKEVQNFYKIKNAYKNLANNI